MINACIFNNDGKLAGCITPSVIEQFYIQFLDLLLVNHGYTDIMGKTFLISKNNNSAEFLNCLKYILKNNIYSLSPQVLQKISKSYHNLVRYCCSKAVYDEVFDETITLLRKEGFQYKGKDVQGVQDNQCTFNYQNIVVGIKICKESDLYNVWYKGEKLIQASVYFKDKKFIINEKNINQLILAIKACVEDCCIDQEQECYLNFDLSQIVEEILNIANNLIIG